MQEYKNRLLTIYITAICIAIMISVNVIVFEKVSFSAFITVAATGFTLGYLHRLFNEIQEYEKYRKSREQDNKGEDNNNEKVS